MKKIYQTIIIGAGPAGLMAGWYLEDALILEQKPEIGKPVQCGEGISRYALEKQGIQPNPSWISTTIDVVQRIMPNGKSFGGFHKERSYILDRTAFEKFLASESKAEIKLNSKVIDFKSENEFWQVKTENGEEFKSKYIIGADGPNSIVRRKVFQERLEMLPAIEYLVTLEKEIKTNTLKIYLNKEKFPQGYAWIFPKSKHRANIGGGGKGNLLKNFNEFLEKEIRENYGNYKLLENRSGVVPFNSASKLFKDGVLLVGDAAGLVDTLFKGGIGKAMWSAKIAAQCILNDEANLYELKIKSAPLFSPKLVEASKILYSLDNQTLNELGEVLDKKGSAYLRTLPGIIKTLSKPHLRKNAFKIFKFFSIWRKHKNYIW